MEIPLRRLVLATLLLVAAPAAAQGDWTSSLYSEGGVELRADERVFTLFAALNALGYDEAPVTRLYPVARRDFDPVRRKVRDAVRLEPALREKFEAFFDKNPLPVRAYTAYALTLGSAPTFAQEKPVAAELNRLKGFEVLLAELYASANLATLFAEVGPSQRDALKRYSGAIDAPLKKVRELMKSPEIDESPRVVLVVNVLDARGAGLGVGLKDEIWLVVGPSGGEPDLGAIVKAFARVLVQDAASQRASGLKGGEALVAAVKAAGFPVGADSVGDYLAESIARTVAAKVTAPDALFVKALERESQQGFVLVKELHRGFVLYGKSQKPFDQFLGDFLRELDGQKAAQALQGG